MMIPISLGNAEPWELCATDASQWVVMKSTEDGKCFKMCMADPAQMFEVACPSIETGGIRRTASPPQNPLAGQTIIKGVPNWVVIGGAAVLGVILVNR